jgi:CopG family nickel-responsive transcriptional regulator
MKSGPQRITLSLAADVAESLDTLVAVRGAENRSQAVTAILREELIGLRRSNPDEVMAGTITLFYDESRAGTRDKIAQLQRVRAKEVVSSLSVILEHEMRMEVLVVQGPVKVLDGLVAELTALRGVQTGKLTLTSAILPPLHDKNPPRSQP